MFNEGYTYKHQSMLDISMWVIGHGFPGEKGTELTVLWLDRNGNLLFISPNKVTVKHTDLHKWDFYPAHS